MRTGGLIGIAFVIFFSCKAKDKIPGNVLPKEKMQAVLWDMMRADQFLTDFVLNKDTSLNKEAESIKLYKQVFSIHRISKEDFQRSFEFYRTHPQMLQELMDSVGRRPAPQPPAILPPDTARKKFTEPAKLD